MGAQLLGMRVMVDEYHASGLFTKSPSGIVEGLDFVFQSIVELGVQVCSFVLNCGWRGSDEFMALGIEPKFGFSDFACNSNFRGIEEKVFAATEAILVAGERRHDQAIGIGCTFAGDHDDLFFSCEHACHAIGAELGFAIFVQRRLSEGPSAGPFQHIGVGNAVAWEFHRDAAAIPGHEFNRFGIGYRWEGDELNLDFFCR